MLKILCLKCNFEIVFEIFYLSFRLCSIFSTVYKFFINVFNKYTWMGRKKLYAGIFRRTNKILIQHNIIYDIRAVLKSRTYIHRYTELTNMKLPIIKLINLITEILISCYNTYSHLWYYTFKYYLSYNFQFWVFWNKFFHQLFTVFHFVSNKWGNFMLFKNFIMTWKHLWNISYLF